MSTYEHRPTIRFFEADQQRVVYHMWYLAYFEDARNAMLSQAGVSLRAIQAMGVDLQIVHYDVDWHGPVRWDDDLVISVAVAAIGRSSFRLNYQALVDGRQAVSAQAVYVVVGLDDGRATPIPEAVRGAMSAEPATSS